jgi:hypothetical protein
MMCSREDHTMSLSQQSEDFLHRGFQRRTWGGRALGTMAPDAERPKRKRKGRKALFTRKKRRPERREDGWPLPMMTKYRKAAQVSTHREKTSRSLGVHMASDQMA